MADSDITAKFARSPVARLATVTPSGSPHLVPVVFAVDGNLVYTAVDGKPKSTQQLRRLANIAENPKVSVLVDSYSDDWTQLWWVRADGTATVHHVGPTAERAFSLLRSKYPQYQNISLEGPVIAIDVQRWASWTA